MDDTKVGSPGLGQPETTKPKTPPSKFHRHIRAPAFPRQETCAFSHSNCSLYWASYLRVKPQPQDLRWGCIWRWGL